MGISTWNLFVLYFGDSTLQKEGLLQWKRGSFGFQVGINPLIVVRGPHPESPQTQRKKNLGSDEWVQRSQAGPENMFTVFHLKMSKNLLGKKLGGNPKIGVQYPKMDGENHGKPLLKWMIWGDFPYYVRKHPKYRCDADKCCFLNG